MRVQAGLCSDVGGYRDVNQDSAFTASWGAAVADGVGGGPSGDLASAALVHRLISGPRPADAQEMLVRLRLANWDIGAFIRRDPALAGMASTLTGIWFDRSGRLLLAHSGDSRGYVLRDGRLTRETRDDSYVQALIDKGLIRSEDAWNHPRRNIITASLGGGEADVIRVETREAATGDRWLLCSDGVTDYVPEDELRTILADEADPQRAAEQIVGLALDAASRDNITAAVCDIVGGDQPSRDVPVIAGAAAARYPEVLEAGLASA